MIVEQNGLAFVVTRQGLLEWLDLTANGEILSLEHFGAELGAVGGNVTGMLPARAVLLASAIRAGLAQGVSAEPQVSPEEFAGAVIEATEQEDLMKAFESKIMGKTRAA